MGLTTTHSKQVSGVCDVPVSPTCQKPQRELSASSDAVVADARLATSSRIASLITGNNGLRTTGERERDGGTVRVVRESNPNSTPPPSDMQAEASDGSSLETATIEASTYACDDAYTTTIIDLGTTAPTADPSRRPSPEPSPAPEPTPGAGTDDGGGDDGEEGDDGDDSGGGGGGGGSDDGGDSGGSGGGGGGSDEGGGGGGDDTGVVAGAGAGGGVLLVGIVAGLYFKVGMGVSCQLESNI